MREEKKSFKLRFPRLSSILPRKVQEALKRLSCFSPIVNAALDFLTDALAAVFGERHISLVGPPPLRGPAAGTATGPLKGGGPMRPGSFSHQQNTGKNPVLN